MQRSLFTAVSGLRNHQTKMDVIGNNIANVNTTAFKAGRVTFQDILSQNIQGASAPQDGRGGINPAQVGLGMSVAGIGTIHTPGSLQNTGRPTDLAIQGSGFFVMSDGANELYSRDGAFSLGSDGDLVNGANGFKPMGWRADAFGNIDTNSPMQTLNIPLGESMTTRATANMFLGSNLDALAAVGTEHFAEAMVYDSQGGAHLVEIVMTKTADNSWEWSANGITGGGTVSGNGTIEFDTYGNFLQSTGDPAVTIAGINGVEDLDMQLDFRGMSQVVGNSNAKISYQDGFPAGELTEFAIGNTGVISGIYSNGLVVELGQIAIATFANPEGLTKAAGNMYQVSSNSGLPRAGLPGQEGRGAIETASLEMSNVDLSYEFTEMITTSRGFQANSRVITTSDDLLQEVVNLKR